MPAAEFLTFCFGYFFESFTFELSYIHSHTATMASSSSLRFLLSRLRLAPAAALFSASACTLAFTAAPAPSGAPAPTHAPPHPAPTAAQLTALHSLIAARSAVPRHATSADIRADMEAYLLRLQDEICAGVQALDGGATPFKEDVWARVEGGGGRSRVLQDGAVFEKAGVGVSIVSGSLPKAAALQMLHRKKDVFGGAGPFPFYAVGLSLVMHPHNPHAPTVHQNYRLFEVVGEDPVTGAPVPVWWYGGGADLTPSVLYKEDAVHFHRTLADVLKREHPGGMAAYDEYKAWCDKYFWIPHRGEARGVGGIFFDDLTHPDGPHALLPFMRAAGEAFLPAYLPLVAARKDTPFTPAQKDLQGVRRGRYVEFNLVHDRGTKFGLATPGSRIESILMSLPLHARWEYCRAIPDGSDEAALTAVLKQPVDWLQRSPVGEAARA